jgi:phosphatidylglycerol:prolipoprotein diacylglycerol transferase
MPTDLASKVTFNAAIWGVIGARVLSIIEEPSHLTTGSFADVLRVLFLEGGLTWYGGLAGGTAATIYTIVKNKAPMMAVFDSMGAAGFVGYAFGRGGCLFSGDGCYGIATTLPWGMQFPKLVESPGFHCMQTGAIAAWPPIDPSTCTDMSDLSTCLRYPADVYVHPTPLYEFLAMFILFAFVWAIRKRLKHPGMTIGLFFALTAIPRFFVEFIRLNPRFFGLSLSQWVAIGSLVIGVGLFLRGRKLPAYDEAPIEEKPSRGRHGKKR